MVEKVYCYKDEYVGYDVYYFLYKDETEYHDGKLIGWLKKEDNCISLWVEEDENFCSRTIELMYDCLYDKKSFKIKF